MNSIAKRLLLEYQTAEQINLSHSTNQARLESETALSPVREFAPEKIRVVLVDETPAEIAVLGFKGEEVGTIIIVNTTIPLPTLIREVRALAASKWLSSKDLVERAK